MAILAIHFYQGCFKAFANLAKHQAQPIYGITIKHLATIFRHKDQMDVHLENTMPAMSNFIVFFHRPSIIQP